MVSSIQPIYKNLPLSMRNPFYVTKASEYSDEQINKYWVSCGSKEVLNPLDNTPKYILGGKGCGKTHLLRYYSYPLQKLRNKGGIHEILSSDKYIGVYSILSTLDASRFEGKNVSREQWNAVFKYYFELYIGAFVLKTISEYIEGDAGRGKEHLFVRAVLGQFLKEIVLPHYDLKSLISFVEKERKNIDFEIENVAFTGNFNNVKINIKAGGLIFGIPILLRDIYDDFKEVKFIYIMDEYEKLFDWQKRYVNSLVWEKMYPSTFWIGARKYGYTDMHTETGEELKKGSEYFPFFMDEYYQKNEKEYEEFSKELIRKRLKREDKMVISELESKFRNGKDEIADRIKVAKKGNYKHLRNLAQKVKLAIKKGIIPDKEDDILEIINNIKALTDENPLEQKYKIYLFYQIWADHSMKSLVEVSKFVNDEYRKYKESIESKFKNIVEKYKSDLIAQLCEENGEEYYAYSGLDDLIKLSWGNPRVLLLLLKGIIEKAEVLQEHPMDSSGQISLRAQYMGIKETSRWYLDDSELTGLEGRFAITAIRNLAEYLRIYRFSDKPTDTSVCSFNYGTEDISLNANEMIRLMELHSLIVKVDNERKQKNSGKSETTYQLNRILAPNWNLPSARRGVADFSKNVMEAIFNNEYFDKFNGEYVALKNRMNAPFISRKENLEMEFQFEE